jgi:ornithine cyclodeaminase/alanine dehydrogenase-like protein (mu-crystallin family)
VLDVIDSARLGELVTIADAIAALRQAVVSGRSTGATARTATSVRMGHLLLMPAEDQELVGVKITGVAPANPSLGLPRITGTYLLHDAATLQPLAAIDGAALTLLRTAALSALAVEELAVPDASRLLIFGTGPQAEAHIRALSTVRKLHDVAVSGRTPDGTAAFVRRGIDGVTLRPAVNTDVRSADLIVCCTSSAAPLFDGSRPAAHATVVAMGSHTQDARELDTQILRRSTVVVEDRETALREAADVSSAVAAKELADVIALADLVAGTKVDQDRPRVFRSVGMAWEDLAVAGKVLDKTPH